MERVNSDRVVKSPSPDSTDTRRELDATQEGLMKKRTDGHDWIVEAIIDLQVTDDGCVRFKADWVGDLAPTWEPRENIS